MDEERSDSYEFLEDEFPEDEDHAERARDPERKTRTAWLPGIEPGTGEGLRMAALFVGGLLFGWLALGWWLFPVEWTDALPADLRADARADYVRMVADMYVRDNDVERARRRLASFQSIEGDLRSVAPIIVSIRAGGEQDPIGRQNVEVLARDLGIPLTTAEGPAGAESGGGQEGGAAAGPEAGAEVEAGAEEGVDSTGDTGLQGDAVQSRSDLLRTLAIAVLIAATGAGAALAWAWAAWRGAPGGRASTHRATDSDADDVRWMRGELIDEPAEVQLEIADPAPGPGLITVGDRADEQASEPRRRRTGGLTFGSSQGKSHSGTPSESPMRIALGETKTIDFTASDRPFVFSWLIMDQPDHVVANAVIEERRLGAVNTLDLKFHEVLAGKVRDGASAVSIVTRAAADDFRLANELLKDRTLVPAIQGDVITLTTDDFAIDFEIREVMPDPSVSDVMELRSLSLALTAFRRVDDDTAGHA